MQKCATNNNKNILLEIKHNNRVGRYAVASRNLKAGDEIFSEAPFAFGPKSDSPPSCLGCCKPVNCTQFCTSCKWPVCNEICEKNPSHKNAECVIFAKAKVRFQAVKDVELPCLQYECIMPLRVLLAAKENVERWKEEVEQMEAHNTIRREKPIWYFNQVNIVNYLRGPCKLKDDFGEEQIHTICGILECNAFEARSTSGYPIRCLFPKLAILSHNCISNISHSISCTGTGDNNDFRVTVRASIDVRKGDELFSSYTYSLWPTLIRRRHLKESKYFECCCTRCSDPAELETHLSSLKCINCEEGILTSTNSLDFHAVWMCLSCNFKHKVDNVMSLFNNIQNELDEIELLSKIERKDSLTKLLSTYEHILHDSNAYNYIIKSSLNQLDSWNNEEMLHSRYEYYKKFLGVLNVVEPGYTRIRGLTLYNLFKLIIDKMKTCKCEDELKIGLQEAMKTLEEAINILQVEPICSNEGKINIEAQNWRLKLLQHFDDVITKQISITSLIKQ